MKRTLDRLESQHVENSQIEILSCGFISTAEIKAQAFSFAVYQTDLLNQKKMEVEKIEDQIDSVLRNLQNTSIP